MPLPLVLTIYNLLLPVVLLLGFPNFIYKGIRRGGLARNFAQRFGFYSERLRRTLAKGDSTWIHAVSVGEVMVAMKIVRKLLDAEPDRQVILTTTTTTGYRVGLEQTNSLSDRVVVIYSPVDLPPVVRLAVQRIKPKRLILVEAEVWPNLVHAVRKTGAPIILTNARLSDRSEKRFQKFGALTIPVFQMLDHVCVPFAPDLKRWLRLGAPPENVTLTGSVKFDQPQVSQPSEKISDLRDWLIEVGFDPDKPILLAGSTHPGEEAMIGKVWLKLRDEFPDLQYVAIPRHAERSREVDRELRSVGIHAAFRVPISSEEPTAPVAAVANTTGELAAWYHLAKIVIVGKSFLSKGGQNPVEPIAIGVPTIVGPNMQNFRDIVGDLTRAGGIIQLDSDESLLSTIRGLLKDPTIALDLANAGRESLAQHQGAANRTIDVITSLR